MVTVRTLRLLLLTFLVAAPLAAHHGRDFLLVQTSETPHGGEFYFIPSASYIDEGEEEEIEVEPTLLFALTNRFSVEVHAHIAKEGSESFEYESTSPALHYRLNSEESLFGLSLSFEYEIAHLDDHEDRAELRLAISQAGDLWLFGANLIASEDQGGGAEVEWGYAAGLRRLFGEDWALGLEVQGSFEEDEHEILLGLYSEPSERFTFNIGVGVGVGSDGFESALRSALVFRLK